MNPVGSIGRPGVDELVVDETTLPAWSCDPYVEDDEVHLSALVAVAKHTGTTALPKVGETYDCETPDGAEFQGECVALSLEADGLAISFHVLEGAENWEGRL